MPYRTDAKLFQDGDFTSHAGLPLKWKLECDAISPNEWRCIAKMIMDYQTEPFRAAVGIPRGGVPLGFALNAYATDNPDHKLLICDDVYTTGTSFKEYCEEYNHTDVYKWVLFSRVQAKDLKYGVRALFTMPGVAQ